MKSFCQSGLVEAAGFFCAGTVISRCRYLPVSASIFATVDGGRNGWAFWPALASQASTRDEPRMEDRRDELVAAVRVETSLSNSGPLAVAVAPHDQLVSTRAIRCDISDNAVAGVGMHADRVVVRAVSHRHRDPAGRRSRRHDIPRDYDNPGTGAGRGNARDDSAFATDDLYGQRTAADLTEPDSGALEGDREHQPGIGAGDDVNRVR